MEATESQEDLRSDTRNDSAERAEGTTWRLLPEGWVEIDAALEADISPDTPPSDGIWTDCLRRTAPSITDSWSYLPGPKTYGRRSIPGDWFYQNDTRKYTYIKESGVWAVELLDRITHASQAKQGDVDFEVASDSTKGDYSRWGAWGRVANEGKWWADRDLVPLSIFPAWKHGQLDPLFSYYNRFLARILESSHLRRFIAVKNIELMPQAQVGLSGLWVDQLDERGNWIGINYPSMAVTAPTKRGEIVTQDFDYKEYSLKEYSVDETGKKTDTVWAVEGAAWKLTPIREIYSKHCVICDAASGWDGAPPPLSVFNPEEFSPEGKKIKKGAVNLDSPTGQFICSYCIRQVKRQNAGLDIPKIKVDNKRGTTAVSEATSPAALMREFQQECPELYSQLSTADGEEDDYLPGYRGLGNGGYWRNSGAED